MTSVSGTWWRWRAPSSGSPAFWDGSDEDRDRLLEALATPDQRLNAMIFATLDLEQHGASNYNGISRPSLAGRAYAQEAVGDRLDQRDV